MSVNFFCELSFSRILGSVCRVGAGGVLGSAGGFAVARADLALDAPVKAAIADGVATAPAPAARLQRRRGNAKKKATTSQNGGNSARTSAATVAKLPLCPVCSASTVVPRATKA